MYGAAASTAPILFAFDVKIGSIDEPEGGSSTQSAAALDLAEQQFCVAPPIIEGEGRAIECVRCTGFDALHKCRQSVDIRKRVIRMCARSNRQALHLEAVGRVFDRRHRPRARR